MTSVSLKLNSPTGEEPETPVAAEVFDLSGTILWSGVIGPDLDTLVQLNPGRYTVQIYLPSGGAVGQTIIVPDEIQSEKPLRLSVGPSSTPDYPTWASWSHPQIQGSGNTSGLTSIWLSLWQMEETDRWVRIPWPTKGIIAETTVSFSLTVPPLPRRWSLQLGGQQLTPRVISLPVGEVRILLAWSDPVGSGSDLSRGRVAVQLGLDSPHAEAILGYLRTGAVPCIRQFLTTYFEGGNLPFWALANPNATLVCAYTLLQFGRFDDLRLLLGASAKQIAESPDLQIIQIWEGVSRLGRFSIKHIPAFLMIGRRLPMFTAGLRLYYDALYSVRSDRQAKQLLEWLEPFIDSTDWGNQQTSYAGESPDRPSPWPRLAEPEEGLFVWFPFRSQARRNPSTPPSQNLTLRTSSRDTFTSLSELTTFPHGEMRGKQHRSRPTSTELGSLEDRIIKIRRCSKTLKGGRRFNFNALVVVGDYRGHVAVGYGKANAIPPAVDKATKDAQEIARRSRRISLQGDTVPHRVIGKYGASQVIIVPAGPGTGVKAGPGVREVLELCGVRNVLTKVHGSTNPINLVKATIAGLVQLRTREEVEHLRGVKLGEY